MTRIQQAPCTAGDRVHDQQDCENIGGDGRCGTSLPAAQRRAENALALDLRLIPARSNVAAAPRAIAPESVPAGSRISRPLLKLRLHCHDMKRRRQAATPVRSRNRTVSLSRSRPIGQSRAGRKRRSGRRRCELRHCRNTGSAVLPHSRTFTAASETNRAQRTRCGNAGEEAAPPRTASTRYRIHQHVRNGGVDSTQPADWRETVRRGSPRADRARLRCSRATPRSGWSGCQAPRNRGMSQAMVIPQGTNGINAAGPRTTRAAAASTRKPARSTRQVDGT